MIISQQKLSQYWISVFTQFMDNSGSLQLLFCSSNVSLLPALCNLLGECNTVPNRYEVVKKQNDPLSLNTTNLKSTCSYKYGSNEMLM